MSFISCSQNVDKLQLVCYNINIRYGKEVAESIRNFVEYERVLIDIATRTTFCKDNRRFYPTKEAKRFFKEIENMKENTEEKLVPAYSFLVEAVDQCVENLLKLADVSRREVEYSKAKESQLLHHSVSVAIFSCSALCNIVLPKKRNKRNSPLNLVKEGLVAARNKLKDDVITDDEAKRVLPYLEDAIAVLSTR